MTRPHGAAVRLAKNERAGPLTAAVPAGRGTSPGAETGDPPGRIVRSVPMTRAVAAVATSAVRTAAVDDPRAVRKAGAGVRTARGSSGSRAAIDPGTAGRVVPATAATTGPAGRIVRTAGNRPVVTTVRGARTARAAMTAHAAATIREATTARVATTVRVGTIARIGMTVRAAMITHVATTARAVMTVGRTVPARRLAPIVPSNPASRTASRAESWIGMCVRSCSA